MDFVEISPGIFVPAGTAGIVEGAEEVAEVAPPLSWGEYLDRTFDLFTGTLEAVTRFPPLAFFTAAGLFLVIASLTLWMLRRMRAGA